MSREAMEMAVEMLTQLIACHGEPRECAAIEAAQECIEKLNAALAEQAHYVAWRDLCRRLHAELCVQMWGKDQQDDWTPDEDDARYAARMQPIRDLIRDVRSALEGQPPAPRPLTGQDINSLIESTYSDARLGSDYEIVSFARALEALVIARMESR